VNKATNPFIVACGSDNPCIKHVINAARQEINQHCR